MIKAASLFAIYALLMLASPAAAEQGYIAPSPPPAAPVPDVAQANASEQPNQKAISLATGGVVLKKNAANFVNDKFGLCRFIDSNSTNDYFIPDRDELGWQSFIRWHPSDVTVDTCCRPRSVTLKAGDGQTAIKQLPLGRDGDPNAQNLTHDFTRTNLFDGSTWTETVTQAYSCVGEEWKPANPTSTNPEVTLRLDGNCGPNCWDGDDHVWVLTGCDPAVCTVIGSDWGNRGTNGNITGGDWFQNPNVYPGQSGKPTEFSWSNTGIPGVATNNVGYGAVTVQFTDGTTKRAYYDWRGQNPVVKLKLYGNCGDNCWDGKAHDWVLTNCVSPFCEVIDSEWRVNSDSGRGWFVGDRVMTYNGKKFARVWRNETNLSVAGWSGFGAVTVRFRDGSIQRVEDSWVGQ